jgi:stage III sporulation protein AD
MNIIFKIIAISLIFTITSIILKQYRREYSFLLALSVIIIILSILIDEFSGFIKEIYAFFNLIKIEHIKSLLKVAGISIVADVICDILDDSGEKAVSNIVCIVIKIIILISTLPMLKEILNFCSEILNK